VKRAAKQILVVLLLVAAAAGGTTVWAVRRKAPVVAPIVAPQPDVSAPAATRVRVQVLNGTKTRGRARRATMVLRDHGFDVVETGTDIVARDTTIVYDVSGHADWAGTVAKLFPPARVVTRLDSSRYLDVTVSIGSTWRPPVLPFYP
jgi:hypothetical protein